MRESRVGVDDLRLGVSCWADFLILWRWVGREVTGCSRQRPDAVVGPPSWLRRIVLKRIEITARVGDARHRRKLLQRARREG